MRERRIMDFLIKLFGDIPLSTAIIFIAAITFIITVGVKSYKLIVNYHDELQEKDRTLIGLQVDVKTVKEKQAEWEDSMATKEELKVLIEKNLNIEKVLKDILETQKNIAKKQDVFEKETRTQTMNRLRDRLLQSYRYYTSEEKNPLKAWSEMEKEAFNSLFKDYENLGGNGYMHSSVEPAMAALEVIEMSNYEKITELMKSRKG